MIRTNGAYNKCPVAIADLVLLYNAAQEGLYGPVKNDRSAFDLFALCQGTKNGFVKVCEAHEQCLRLDLHDFRVIRADAAESDTYINVGGFLANSEWTTGKTHSRARKVVMQFFRTFSITTAFVTVISRRDIAF